MTISIYALWLFIILFYCAIGTWKLFEKAGRKQWEGIVPLYNIYVWLKIINKPWWWGLILLIPGWNLLLMLGAMNVSMGRIFNRFSVKDTIMQIVVPFIYFPMLAYDKEVQYFGETNWEDTKQRDNRKWSDQIALLFASFGIINVLVTVLKITGSKDKPHQKSMVKEWGDSIIFALIAASMIRGYVLEAFTIPTPSMEKELLVGDFLFVNKLAYGTRIPLTPISFPLAHNTVPFTYVNSYSTAIKLPYYRLPGFGKVKRNDIVVFNHPVGDTAIFGRYPGSEGAGGELQGHNYFQFVRQGAISKFLMDKGISSYGMHRIDDKLIEEFFSKLSYYESISRKELLENNKLYRSEAVSQHATGYVLRPSYFETSGYTTRPIDKKENYVKRCVAVAGDTLQIIDGVLYVNGKENVVGENVNITYRVSVNRKITEEEKSKFKENYDFNLQLYSDISDFMEPTGIFPINTYNVNMSPKILKNFEEDINKGLYGNLKIDSISPNLTKIDGTRNQRLESYQNIYPCHPLFPWTIDNYGPLWMPKEGVTIPMNYNNWIKYKRCIVTYENNPSAIWKGDGVYINDKKLTQYTFKQNYYYMIGDNRHNSADSRSWGFVPEDHVVGKGLIIWMSKDQEKGWFDGGIRWGRIFKTL